MLGLFFGRLAALGDPFGMLAGDEGFDPLGHERFGVRGLQVRPGLGQLEMLFVLQGLLGGAVGHSVVLILVQALQTFQDDDKDSQPPG